MKPTSGIIGHCTSRFSIICARRTCTGRRRSRRGGIPGRHKVETTHLVDAGGKLPVIITFVDTDEHVNRVLPALKEMAAHRLIVRENVVLEQGNLD